MERVRNRPRYEIQHTVMPASELTVIKTLLTQNKGSQQRAEMEQREKLKQLSEARVKEWPNTIEALRLKKEADRNARLNNEEEARKKIDAEEAAYQEKQRAAAIERANLILYEQDDRIKNFNSKMFLSHVLEERQKQLALREARKERVRKTEAEWHATVEKTVAEGLAKEQKEKELRVQKALQTEKEQKEQLAQVEARLRAEQAAAKAEGQAIRKAAEDAIIEEMAKEKAIKEKAMQLGREYAQINLDAKKYKIMAQEAEQAENERIQQFANLKEQQMLERKRRTEEKTRQDMERREAMINRQAAHLASLNEATEERIQKQVNQKAKEKENREAQDRAAAEKKWNDIKVSRSRQLAQKEKKKQHEIAAQAAARNQWAQAAEQLLIEEMEERQDRVNSNKRLLAFQKMQIKEKEIKAQAEKEQEKLEGVMMRQALEEEEEMFSKYVSTVMDEYTQKGRDLGALRSTKRRGDVC